MLKERIVFIGPHRPEHRQLRSARSLLLLEAEDHERDIEIYIQLAGWLITDGLAIYDTMQYVPATCAPSASAWLPRWASSCSVRYAG